MKELLQDRREEQRLEDYDRLEKRSRLTYDEKVDRFVEGLKSPLCYVSDGKVGILCRSYSFQDKPPDCCCEVCGSKRPLFLIAITDGIRSWWVGGECEKELVRRKVLSDKVIEMKGG